MQRLPDELPLSAPGICFLCERSPDREEPVVDTLVEFRPQIISHLSGRKYVCGLCIRTLLQAVLEPELEEEII
jgi:hypothetical protein